MPKLLPNIEEFKDLPANERSTHLKRLATAKYVSFALIILLLSIYTINNGWAGVNTAVGVISGMIGFILLGSSRSPVVGLAC
jgi:hypothetical protein